MAARRRPVTAALSGQTEAAAGLPSVSPAVGGEPAALGRCFLAASISDMLAPRDDIETGRRLPLRNGGANGRLAKPRSEDPTGGLRADGGELPDKRGEAKR